MRTFELEVTSLSVVFQKGIDLRPLVPEPAGKRFSTLGDRFTRGKRLFHAVEYLPPAELPDSEYPLMLTTGRVLYQHHTASMTGRCEGLQFRYPQGYVEIHERDASALGIRDQHVVRVSSRRGSIEITAQVTDRSMPGSVFIPFHFFEVTANRLTHSKLDPIGKIPEFKVCALKVERLSVSAGLLEQASGAAV